MSLAALLALVAPPLCLACRAPLDGPGELLCGACSAGCRGCAGWRCPRCALPRHRGAGCPAAAASFGAAHAAMAYEGGARALVQALKFRGALPAAGLMAAQLAAVLPPLGASPSCPCRRSGGADGRAASTRRA